MADQKVLDAIEEVRATGALPLEFVAPKVALSVADRGDCCQSQAYGRALKGKDTLLFCGHHLSRHLPALLKAGWRVDDQRDRIVADAKKDAQDRRANAEKKTSRR